MSQMRLSHRFDALSQREKIMTLCAGLVLILLVGLTYGIEPAMKASSAASQGIKQERARQSSLAQQVTVYSDALNTDPNAQLKRELDTLRQQQTAIQARFADELGELVMPWEMPAVIDNVFANAVALELEEMTSLPPVNLMANNPDMKGVELYQHGVSLTFRGGYFDVRDFLASLEAEAGELYWQELDYSVGEYPAASVKLTVYTLSTNKAFIGVR